MSMQDAAAAAGAHSAVLACATAAPSTSTGLQSPKFVIATQANPHELNARLAGRETAA